jgi:hypothetical protein
MSKRMPKLECEVHLDAPVDLQQPELHGFIALESTQVRLTAVYWDTHERLLGWGHTVRHRAASDGSESGWTVELSEGDAKEAVARNEISSRSIGSLNGCGTNVTSGFWYFVMTLMMTGTSHS